MKTVVTYDTWAAGGPRVDIVSASFRRDRLIVGIAVERWIDPPPTGTPTATVVAPAVSGPAQERLALDLAATLDRRITDVLAGNAPVGVDLTMPDRVLPLDQLTAGETPVWGGYKTGVDLLRCGICGEENSLLPFAGDALGGFTRGLALGSLVDGQPRPPFVTVALVDFASPEAAREVLEAIRETPDDLPTPVPIPRGRRTLAPDPTIPGVTDALAFHASLDTEDPNAPVDSAEVVFVLGKRLVTVYVQGGLSAEGALAAAVDLARQQAGCLSTGDPCRSAARPPTMGEE